MSSPEAPAGNGEAAPRREFLKASACVALGACALAAPIGAVVVVLAHPLHARGIPLPVKLTTLTALPLNGPPRLFQVVTERRDAWTRFPRTRSVPSFSAAIGEREVIAFNSACPHLGCSVEFRPERDSFYCPCHDSEFARTGEVRGVSPSRRGLDTLRVEIRDEHDVWVYFENFKTGIAEKVSVA
jgi:Rieske Fe-S protein